jgi:hypothetical protein
MTAWAWLIALLTLQGLSEQSSSASISGIVVRAGANEPIAGAYVELSRYELSTGGSVFRPTR